MLPLGALGVLFIAAIAATARSQGVAIPASRLANKVGIISISGPIDDLTLASLQRRNDAAAKDGCDAIVIEFDTPGGELGATLAMCHLIKTQPPVRKVAWIRPNAFSAGAILALACREIVVAPDSVIGDAAPIQAVPGVGGMGMQPIPVTERAKIEAPVLSEVTESAMRNGYDVRLVRAMITVEDELWLVERDDGKRLFVNAQEYALIFGAEPERGAGGYVPSAAPRSLPNIIEDDGAARDMELLAHAPRVKASERGRWTLLGQVDTSSELVTLRGSQAILFGLATATVADEQQLLDYFGAKELRRYDESWSESLVRFLVSWPVRAILIVVMVVCFFVEMATPGFGAFGSVAAVAFLVLIGAPMLTGLAQWWEVLLILAGGALIIVELFVIPGMGVFGIVGAICILVGLVFTFVGGDLASSQSQSNLLLGLLATLGSFVIAGIGLAILSRHLPNMPFFQRFSLEASIDNVATAPLVRLAAPLPEAGNIGSAVTDLRPSGRAQFGDRVADVRTTGAWINRGARVRVVGGDGLGLIVEDASA
ncbi:MAG: NfeD family protein [Phycisphaerae bacterium]|nr:NfeD family protein [Phycisphaerae bacterium]